MRFMKLRSTSTSWNRLLWMSLGIVLLTRPSLHADIVNGVNIPASHPRLWWDADRLARARTWYQSNPFTPSASDPLGQATRCVITGEATYCQQAVNYAMTQLCGNAACNSSDPNVGVAADDARWYGEDVVLIFDWCYAYFTPAQRATLIARWNTYFTNIRLHTWGGPSMIQSNYNWGYMRNEMLWGIATYGDNAEATINLNYGLTTRWGNNIAPDFTNGRGKGGVFQEGSAYGGALGEYSTVPFGSISLLGRDIYRETNFFREAVFYMIYSTLPGLTYNKTNNTNNPESFPFADDERFADGGNIARALFGTFMSGMADFWRAVPVGAYARQWLNSVNPAISTHLKAVDHGGTAQSFTTLPLDYYASGAPFFYTRNQWGSNATVIHLQLGKTDDEGHSHNDAGSWQIWRSGRWQSRESTGYVNNIVGYGGATVDTNDFSAHNTLMLGSRGPATGWIRGTASVNRLESQSDYSYVATDLTEVYRASHPVLDNTDVAHVEREFLFIRALETMIIFDRAESVSAATTKTFLAHFENAPTVDAANRVITGTNGTQVLRVLPMVPSNSTIRPIVTEGGVGQYRLEVEAPGGTLTHLMHVLQSKGSSDPNITASVSETASSYTLTLTHPSLGITTVVFQKGRVSTGGTITTGGQTRNLTTTVMPITVSDTGVTWGAGSQPPANPCDLNGGGVSVSDVQLCANQAIGVSACGAADINRDGLCTVVDVQRVVNAALGGQCVTQ